MTTKSLRRRPDRTLFMLLQMSGDVHPNPGPATKYPCPVYARNVTSRGVSYQCNRCSGCVHAKCSGLLNAAQFRRSCDWACGPCSTPTPSPPPTPTYGTDLWTQSGNSAISRREYWIEMDQTERRTTTRVSTQHLWPESLFLILSLIRPPSDLAVFIMSAQCRCHTKCRTIHVWSHLKRGSRG